MRTSKPSMVWTFRRSRKRRRRRHAGRLVAARSDVAVDERRRRRLAEVVGDGAEHHRQRAAAIEPVEALAGAVDDHQRVHPHVALRVPLGILLAADQRLQLRPQLVDHAEVERQPQADRRPLAPAAAASRTRPRCARRADRRAEWRGRSPRSRREPRVEAGRELQRPQHPQAVVAERHRIDDPQHPVGEVVAAVERIEVRLAQRIPRDRVDGEVAAPRRLLRIEVRIADHLEPLVAAPDLRLAAGQRHVEAADLVDGEALADGVDRAELGEQRLELAADAGRRPRGRDPWRSRPSSRSRTQPPTISARAAGGVDGAGDRCARRPADRRAAAAGPRRSSRASGARRLAAVAPDDPIGEAREGRAEDRQQLRGAVRVDLRPAALDAARRWRARRARPTGAARGPRPRSPARGPWRRGTRSRC